VGRRADASGLDGVLVLAKPAGPTSHDVVALVRRLTGTRRVGHGGTLDPFATGVLPLFLGGATRLVEYHLGDRKGYRATVCFGASSTTDDLDGELTPVDGPQLSATAVEADLATFRGEIRQRPPAFSAIQVGGRRAYAMARGGAPAELGDRVLPPAVGRGRERHEGDRPAVGRRDAVVAAARALDDQTRALETPAERLHVLVHRLSIGGPEHRHSRRRPGGGPESARRPASSSARARWREASPCGP